MKLIERPAADTARSRFKAVGNYRASKSLDAVKTRERIRR
jgi:hypothetical protein